MKKDHNKIEPEQEEKTVKGEIRPEEPVEEQPAEAANPQEKEIRDLRGQLIRLKAEFDNYRRRVEKEKELRFSYGKQSILTKLIDLVEIFDKAVEHTKDSRNAGDVAEGLKLIHKEFVSFITKEGVKPMETTGTKFNHNLHEIVGFEETGADKEDIILKEVQRGDLCDGEPIRPAKVIVGRNKPEEQPQKKTGTTEDTEIESEPKS